MHMLGEATAVTFGSLLKNSSEVWKQRKEIHHSPLSVPMFQHGILNKSLLEKSAGWLEPFQRHLQIIQQCQGL